MLNAGMKTRFGQQPFTSVGEPLIPIKGSVTGLYNKSRAAVRLILVERAEDAEQTIDLVIFGHQYSCIIILHYQVFKAVSMVLTLSWAPDSLSNL